MVRADGRGDESLREIKITRGYQQWPAGSVLVEFGNTRVLCAASVNDGVPRWRAGSGLGWVTAEYAMLPSATHTRGDRESVKGKIGGRTHEISRLIGRALRACIDLSALGENTIVIDCDVIQADGGTRTAAITGAYVALADAITWLEAAGRLADPKPLSCSVSAVSVGVIDGRVRLDLPYEEDARAEVDMNVVATDAGTLVEVQGTGEGATFARSTLDQMLDLALAGCAELTRLQNEALALPYPGQLPEPSPKGRRKS
ncbi:MAG TPA: ribonuclease PH [Kutzneria sp.]